MKILLIVTAATNCNLFYKVQKQLQRDNAVKILFTENAKKMLDADLYWYFQHDKAYESLAILKDPKNLYQKVSGKGFKYKGYVTRYEKFSCTFNASKEINGGFQHQLYIYNRTQRIQHVELAKWADKIVIFPCTINTYNKMNNKISDNFVLSVLSQFLSLSKPVYCFFDKSYENNDNFKNRTVTKEFNSIKNIFDLDNIKNIVNVISDTQQSELEQQEIE